MQDKFSFNADLGQMPFPPMVMNGPHFHPPMKILINQMPNINPRTEMNPLELQAKELEQEKNSLTDILEHIETLEISKELTDLKKVALEGSGSSFNAILANAGGRI